MLLKCPNSSSTDLFYHLITTIQKFQTNRSTQIFSIILKRLNCSISILNKIQKPFWNLKTNLWKTLQKRGKKIPIFYVLGIKEAQIWNSSINLAESYFIKSDNRLWRQSKDYYCLARWKIKPLRRKIAQKTKLKLITWEIQLITASNYYDYYYYYDHQNRASLVRNRICEL